MIPSVDTYVYNELKSKLKAILTHEHILDEALKGIDETARENFKLAYSGHNPEKTIEVSYHFPQMKENFDARLIVQIGEGRESSRSLGSVQGTYTYRTGSMVTDDSVVEDDGERLYLEVTNEIGSVESYGNISFGQRDEVETVGNRIYFRKDGNAHLIGRQYSVTYEERIPEDKDPKGMKRGYSANEQVEITPLSNNMDTARCLDAILKVLFIILLENKEEKTGFLLQKATFSAMQNIVRETEMESVIFGRALLLEYDVSYEVDFDILTEINEVVLRGVDSIG